jgi:hypothetical protein
LFLLSDAALSVFDVANYCVAFFLTVALFLSEVGEDGVSGSFEYAGFAFERVFTFLEEGSEPINLFESESMEFEEAGAFGAKELLFASEGAEFFFEVFFGACEVFELEAEPSLEVALFGEECLAFFFDFFAESLLFGFDMLSELFALSLEFFGLLSEFV